MSAIKINRAMRLSIIGACPGSAQALLDAIPPAVVAAVTSRQLAALLDAAWQLAQASKALAHADAITEGCIWDARQKRVRELAA